MPRIRCHYIDCVFLDDGFCGTSSVVIDPDEGCMTYSQLDELGVEDDWEEDDLEEIWEVEDVDILPDEEEDDEDDLWLEEDL